jgi:hypothetical protein
VSDNFVQAATRGANADTTTTSVTLNGVTAGNTLVAFLFDGSVSAPTTHTVSDGQGAYTSRGSAADATNNVFGEVFTLVNANAGTHVVTGTVDTSGSCWIAVVEVGTILGASSFSDAKAAFQSSPGAGANALSSGSITVSGAATIVGFSTDTAVVNVADEPTTGTSPFTFASRDANATSVMGSYRLETAPGAANGAATAGPVVTTDNFITLGIAILNGGAATPPSGPIPGARRMTSLVAIA